MDNISFIVERFFKAQKKEIIPYFDVEEIVQLIDHFLDEEDVDNLHEALKIGYELHPNNLQISIASVKTLILMEKFETALESIEKIAHKENKELVLLQLECYFGCRRPEDALLFLDELKAENCPHFEDAVVYMAGLLNDLEMHRKEALMFIKKSLTMFPDNFLLRTELCYNIELQGKTKEALDLCCQLIDENPFATEVWYMQGRLYAAEGDYEKAIESLDFALTCIEDDEPDFEYELKQMKALYLYKNESYEKAISVYKDMESNDFFASTEVNPYLGECYMKMGDYENAYHALKKVFRHEDFDGEVSLIRNFLLCCIETGRKDEALDVLTDTLKSYPDNIDDYPSIFEIMNDPFLSYYAKKKKRLTPGDLARDYLNHKYNYN